MATEQAAGEAPRLTRKGQLTRERIVAAAAGLMFAKGVACTSIEDVQAAAGVSTSQIYHYFADKRSLVRAVIAHQTDAVLDAQQPLLSRLDSIDALRTWRDFAVGVQRQLHCIGGCPIGSLGSEMAECDAEARRDVAAGFRRWERAIGEGLRLMRGRGELRAEADPDRLALALLAALQGGLLLAQINRNTLALEAAMDAVIERVASLQAGPDEVPAD
jgi:AcrR family transcriptional regulator